jgi:signal transduction histidine kinase
MLDFWRDNIHHLTNDEPEEWELPYYVISKEADRLGISLNIIGELPSESRLIPVVDAAISVHIGNTLKHADGTEATVAVKKKAEGYVISFTNNGRQPEEEIKEKGGLKNLRSQVEGVGGKMEIISAPEFEMRITLPGVSS